MTDKKPKKPPPETDPIQSERFRKLVSDLEADGELNPIVGEAAVERILRAANRSGKRDPT